MSFNQFSGSIASAFASPNCTCSPCNAIPGRQAALNASSGGVALLSTIALTTPINVVSTTIDTRDMCRTNNLLTFTCIVILPAATTAALNFQIRRSLNDGTATNVGSTYTFATTTPAAVLLAQSFSFQFLDTDVQPGFYTYSVQLSPGSVVSVTGASITNAVLSVLAVTNR